MTNVMSRGHSDSARSRRGFTLAEVLVSIVVSSFILAAIYQIMSSQVQLFSVQASGGEVRATLRGAANLMVAEIMELSNDGSDLYSMNDTSLVLRSPMATGIVCYHQVQSGKRILGLRQTSGYWEGAVAGDSLIVWDPGSNSWNRFIVDASWTGSAALTYADRCFWGDSTTSQPRPEVAVRLSTNPNTVTTGSMMRRFQRVEYGAFSRNGRWWFGHRYGSSTTWELITGPLAQPSAGGLAFSYWDGVGAATSNPAEVSRIGISIRAESTGRSSALAQAGGSGVLSDSITLDVAVHNVR